MVRAPCCDKDGVKKGPWTPEEDQLLVAYIQQHGHDNWRKLPKKAGLLRCGKSCRLRWTNYLRPDIKRGNFNKEEENTIILLHQQLGNKWSAIAAKLPGRTDNEIKNVWHTHLKKTVGYKGDQLQRKRKVRSSNTAATDDHKKKRKLQKDAGACIPTMPKATRLEVADGSQEVAQQAAQNSTSPGADGPVSPSNSFCSGFHSTSSSSGGATEGIISSLEALLDVDIIDEGLWSEAHLSLHSSTGTDHMVSDWTAATTISSFDDSIWASCGDDDVEMAQMGYWLKVFMEAGDTMQNFY